MSPEADRDYFYISKRLIDHYADELEAGKRDWQWHFGLNLGVFTLGFQQRPPSRNYHRAARDLTAGLKNHRYRFGMQDYGAYRYFLYGTFAIRWCLCPSLDGPVALLAGTDAMPGRGRIAVILYGSPGNLIGHRSSPGERGGWFPSTWMGLRSVIAAHSRGHEVEASGTVPHGGHRLSGALDVALDIAEGLAPSYTLGKGSVEVLAQVDVSYRNHRWENRTFDHVILGSPLWAARSLEKRPTHDVHHDSRRGAFIWRPSEDLLGEDDSEILEDDSTGFELETHERAAGPSAGRYADGWAFLRSDIEGWLNDGSQSNSAVRATRGSHMLTVNRIYEIPAWGSNVSRVWVRIYESPPDRPLVLCTQTKDNHGPSVTNAAEDIATWVRAHLLGGRDARWVEHYLWPGESVYQEVGFRERR